MTKKGINKDKYCKPCSELAAEKNEYEKSQENKVELPLRLFFIILVINFLYNLLLLLIIFIVVNNHKLFES